MKLPGIRLLPVERPVRGQSSTDGAEALQQLFPAGLTRDLESPSVRDVDFVLFAFFQLQGLLDGSGQTNGYN